MKAAKDDSIPKPDADTDPREKPDNADDGAMEETKKQVATLTSNSKVTDDEEGSVSERSVQDDQLSGTTGEHEQEACDESDTSDGMQTQDTENEQVENANTVTEPKNDLNFTKLREAPLSNTEQYLETDFALKSIYDKHIELKSTDNVDGESASAIQGTCEHVIDEPSEPQCDPEPYSHPVKQQEVDIVRDSNTFKHLKYGIETNEEGDDPTDATTCSEIETKDPYKNVPHISDNAQVTTDDMSDKPPSLASVAEDSDAEHLDGMDIDDDTMPELVNSDPTPSISPQLSTEEEAPMDLSCHHRDNEGSTETSEGNEGRQSENKTKQNYGANVSPAVSENVSVMEGSETVSCIPDRPEESRLVADIGIENETTKPLQAIPESKPVSDTTTIKPAHMQAIQTPFKMTTRTASPDIMDDTSMPILSANEPITLVQSRRRPHTVVAKVPSINVGPQAVLPDSDTASEPAVQTESKKATSETAPDMTHVAKPVQTSTSTASEAAQIITDIQAAVETTPSERVSEQLPDAANGKSGLMAANNTPGMVVGEKTHDMATEASATTQVVAAPTASPRETIPEMAASEGTSSLQVCEFRAGDLMRSHAESITSEPCKTLHNIQLQIEEEEGTDSNDSVCSVQLTKACKSMELSVSLVPDQSKVGERRKSSSPDSNNDERLANIPTVESDPRPSVSAKPTHVAPQRTEGASMATVVSKTPGEGVNRVASNENVASTANRGANNKVVPTSTAERVVTTAQQHTSSAVSHTTPNTKAAPQKLSDPGPIVIDLDAGSAPVPSHRDIAIMEKTPTKQVQTKQAQKSPRTPGQTTSKQTPSKSPNPTGKQSFIDNLIATGVPIVIPDDDDDDDDGEEEETSMDMGPQARSNIFKMKSQQYREQGGSIAKGRPPGTYRKNVAMHDSPQYFTAQGENYGRSGAGGQGDSYGRSAAMGQGESYGRPPATGQQQQHSSHHQQQSSGQPRQASQDILDMVREQVHRDVYMQQDNPAPTPPRGAMPTGMMSPPAKSAMVPMQSFTPPRAKDPNKRVTFSPVSNVYQIPPNTPPRHTSPQRFVTPTRPILASPRMASPNTSQISQVRRNIASPRQQQSSLVPPNRGREPTIVIDDDVPPPHRAPLQATPTKRPMPQQTHTRRPEEVTTQQTQQTRPRQILPHPQETGAQQRQILPRQTDNVDQPIIIDQPQKVRSEVSGLQQRQGQRQYTAQAEVKDSQPNLPVIASVTSMAKEPEQLHSPPPQQQHKDIQQQQMVTQQQQQMVAQQQQQLATQQQQMIAQQQPMVIQPQHVVSQQQQMAAQQQQMAAQQQFTIAQPQQLVAQPQHVVLQPQYLVIQPQHMVSQPQHMVSQQQQMVTQLSDQGQATTQLASYIQHSNEKTSVKRSRSPDTMSMMTSPDEEPASKRRGEVDPSSLPGAGPAGCSIKTEPVSTEASDPAYSSVTVVVKEPPQQPQQQAEPAEETISPSKRPPEVFIDVDVDDKSTVKRRLNIEQGHITTTSPVTSPEAGVTSFGSNNMTSPDSTNSAMTTRGKGKVRPRATATENFSCRDCGKNCTSKAALKMHSKTHSGEAFECDVCGKHFSQKSSLKKHIYTHFNKDKDKDT